MSKKTSGRPENEYIRHYFTWNTETEKSRCNIGSCKQTMKGRHSGNLERHILRNHAEEAMLIRMDKERRETERLAQRAGTSNEGASGQRKKRKLLTIKMDEEIMRTACRELVTVTSLPFSIFQSAGMRKFLDPILEALNKEENDQQITINRQNIKLDIAKEAERIRDVIKLDVKGKMVCLKMDTATRLGRQVMGINIQFILNGKLTLRTLCVKELFLSHTADNLKQEIVDILRNFGISTDMLYSGTTDNAANVVKAVKLLASNCSTTNIPCIHRNVYCEETEDDPEEFPVRKDCFDTLDVDSDETDFSDEEQVEEDTQLENQQSDDTDEYESSGGPKQEAPCAECGILKSVLVELGVIGVRCAAHTLQLSVDDALKICKSFDTVVKNSRKLCKQLRTPTVAKLLKDLGCTKPLLDVVTRWNSMYDMLQSLLKLKNACKQIEELQKQVQTNNERSKRGKQKNKRQINSLNNISDSDWNKVEEICNSLHAAKIASKIFQSDQLTVGDFYDCWLRCKLKTSDVDSTLARELVRAMEKRESELLSTPAFSSALFMDPRYRILLSDEQKNQAEVILQALWARILMLQSRATDTMRLFEDLNPHMSGPSVQNYAFVEDEDPVEKLIRQRENIVVTSCTCIVKLLKNYEIGPRLARDKNILDYWESRKQTDPELYQLAVVVLAVPMTQVSVERIFSQLRQVLSILRYNLSSSMIDDILIVRCNSMFLSNNL